MPTLYPLQDSFVRGEISPRLHARASLELYRAGLAKCINFLTLPHGGLRKRGGTRFVGEVKVSAEVNRLIQFVFSSDQSYALVLGNLQLRVYAYGARVGTVEVATPWTSAELADIQFYQSADQMWLAHRSHPLMVLTRTAHTAWTLDEYVLEDGPYGEVNTSGTKLFPADYGSSVPLMTSDSTPSGAVSVSSGSDGFRLFDKTIEPYNSGGTGPGFASYTFGGGVTKTVNAYALEAYGAGFEQLCMPSSWKFQGQDGGTWITLDSRSAETGWAPGEKRFYEFTNKTPYAAYRLVWSATEQPGGETLTFAELSLNQDGDEQTPFNLTASGAAGINGGSGFLASDVGRAIRLQGSDGEWRWARIVSVVSGGTVDIRLYGHALPDLSPIINWRLGALSGDSHASAVLVYEERLALASRFSAFLSKTGDLDDFSPGEADDAGMSFTNAGGGQANDIVWLADGDGYLLMATTGGVRMLSGSGIDEALTPTSFKNRRSRTFGAARIPPVDAGSSFLYVTRSRRTIAELRMNQYGRFSSDDVGQISEHIPKKGVKAIAWAENPDPVLWFVVDLGELGGYTHQPAQEVRGMHRHRTGEPLGQTGGGPADVFESICVTPGADGQNDDVWLIVRRTIGGVTKRYIEMLTAPAEGIIAGAAVDAMDGFCVDSGLTYEGSAVGTVTGLSHLNGEAVSVLAETSTGARVYEGLTVSGGAVTLPGGVTAAKWHVGLPYGAVAETLELDVGGKDGSMLGRRKRISKVILSVSETDISGLQIRSLLRGAWERVRIPSVVAPDGTVSLFTGNVEVPVDDSWEGRGKIQLAHLSPTPCTIRGAVPVYDQEP